MFLGGLLLIIGGFVLYATTAEAMCNGNPMLPTETCLIEEEGAAVEYGYEERLGYQAGQASVYALVAIGLLGGLCFYLYPRNRSKAQTSDPAVEDQAS
ncbi:hypothetical protein [Allorhizocola rhizosphaerae]|uniref:hypothetical protein n=1 Tax=Allorhizocola rhizosphaerae TaxID=1872709 RepID=UPI0013C366CB|nr:hypothetical protein [Allorhizocola rhizosphaerae]